MGRWAAKGRIGAAGYEFGAIVLDILVSEVVKKFIFVYHHNPRLHKSKFSFQLVPEVRLTDCGLFYKQYHS